MNKDIHPTQVAGQFYPARTAELLGLLADLRAQAERALEKAPKTQDHPTAIILPHAGYIYSGFISFATLLSIPKTSIYKRVVIIAPSHRADFTGIALGDFAAMATPLSDIPVESDTIAALAQNCGDDVCIDERPFLLEHALEVQLPFITDMWKDASIVPIIAGRIDDACARRLAAQLAPLMTPDTLFLISSDFTHYGRSFDYIPFKEDVQENLRKLDFGAAGAILSGDISRFDNYLAKTGATICGASPIRLLMAMFEHLNVPPGGRLVAYSNSGEVTGDFSHAVSYCGMIFNGK